MHLRKLEIHGFKSFAKKTVLEFEPGITSIVGPNGSGKSNIADALRWVFGEQSMKLMRSKKAEDVIFAGSDQKARLGSAEAAVHFDNTDHLIPIDYNEVVITRRVYRDGNSEYLINGNVVRLMDIQELIGKSGFGNSSYHVIGQGMIDQLILGGSSAIKELLEEAAGIKPYYQKREQTLRKLERTEDNLEKASALVSEIEPRLRSLRRQTKKFEQRADIEKELKHAQALHFSQILTGLDRQILEVDSQMEMFDRQINELSAEIGQFSEAIERDEKTRREDVVEADLRTKLAKLQNSKLAFLEEQAVLRGKLAAGQLQTGLERNIDWTEIRNKFRKAYENLRSVLADIDRWRTQPQNWQAEADRVEKQFRDIWEKIDDQNEQKPKATNSENEQQRLHFLEEELGKLAENITHLEKELAMHEESEKEKKNQLFVKERLLRSKQDTLLKTRDQKNQLAVEHARFVTRREGHEHEAATALGDNFREQLRDVTGEAAPHGLPEKIAQLAKQLEMIGGVDDLVLKEYQETEKRYEHLTTQSADLEKGVADLKKVIEELDEVIKLEFQTAFDKISEKFGEYFKTLFAGGRATMTILKEKRDLPSDSPPHEEGQGEVIENDNEEEPAATNTKPEIVGIDIRATPPGKKLAGIAALSGGERTLTAIALLSAILATYPSPFVVLDEVDAALDEANSIRFGLILGTLAHRTQFITITHNRETMRQSHTLYGITMGEDGISKILSLKLSEAAAYSTKN